MADLLSYALCSVADVTSIPGFPTTSISDDFIKRKINQATEMIEGYCGRRFKETTYTDEKYDGTLTSSLVLKQRPIKSSDPFIIKGRSGATSDSSYDTIDSSFYFIDYDAGIVDAVSSFYSGYDRWAVTYTAGYATIPADLQEACATLAAYLAQNSQGTGGISSKQEGSRKVDYFNTTGAEGIIGLLHLDEILDGYASTSISGLI